MQELSALLNQLEESATLAMARRSREMAEQGIDVISLSLGEPDFDVPDFIKEAAKEGVDKNFSKYPPVNGYLDLRMSIAHKFKRDNGLNYAADQIVVSNGAKQSIANACLSLINPGQEVVLPAPYWVSYSEIVKMAGGVPVVIPTTIEQDFKITPEQLEAAITPKTKLIIFSSPCNPSGSVFTHDELKALSQVVARHNNLYVISDEIYEHINYTGQHFSMAALPGMAERVITVNGVSKAFAMTGYRIGYLGAPTWIAKACSKVQGQFTSAPSSISQRAAKAAVDADPSEISYMREAFLKRRDLVVSLLSEISGLKVNQPPGAFYVLPDVTALFGKSAGEWTINSADDLCEYILDKAHVALVSGGAFGAPDCLRISYASSEDTLRNAVQRISQAIAELN
ncbi:MAG: pyridoxal phosphate-dependent aminotransferase [Cryomorphaceae bacterium]|nr:MAG: pyridoxal phosphate-dependent aminotransferase [Cryomorphaceae bacterium]